MVTPSRVGRGPVPGCPMPGEDLQFNKKCYWHIMNPQAVPLDSRPSSALLLSLPSSETFPLPSLRVGPWLGGVGWRPGQTGPGRQHCLEWSSGSGVGEGTALPHFYGGGGIGVGSERALSFLLSGEFWRISARAESLL